MFARAREAEVHILCRSFGLPEERTFEEETGTEEVDPEVDLILSALSAQEVSLETPIPWVRTADVAQSAAEYIIRNHVDLLVAVSEDPTGETGATSSTSPLLRRSPCNTVILFTDRAPGKIKNRVLVLVQEGPHDRAAISLAGRLARIADGRATVVPLTEESGEEAVEVGRREILQAVRDSGVDRKRIRPRVFPEEELSDLIELAEKQDLILIGANNPLFVRQIRESTDHPAIAVIKRAPPLRPWKRNGPVDWAPRLSPAEYADLIAGLRRGSRLSVDFLVMLGMAAAIASLGLLQDSPAVVIGSMLLAPLMTPMIGNGLALAQANPKLGKSSANAFAIGFLLTLSISYVIAPDPRRRSRRCRTSQFTSRQIGCSHPSEFIETGPRIHVAGNTPPGPGRDREPESGRQDPLSEKNGTPERRRPGSGSIPPDRRRTSRLTPVSKGRYTSKSDSNGQWFSRK